MIQFMIENVLLKSNIYIYIYVRQKFSLKFVEDFKHLKYPSKIYFQYFITLTKFYIVKIVKIKITSINF